jgi:hypothetical protein
MSNTEEGRDFILYDGVLARSHHTFETRWREMFGGGEQCAYPPFSHLSMYNYRSPLDLHNQEKEKESKQFHPGEESDMEEDDSFAFGDDEDDEWDEEDSKHENKKEIDVFLETDLTRPFIERSNKTCVVVDDDYGMLCVCPVFRGSMCRKHYERWRKTPDSRCSMDECNQIIQCNGLCRYHSLLTQNKLGSTSSPKTCSASDDDDSTKGCTFPSRAMGLCSKHYIRKHRRTNQRSDNRQTSKTITSPQRHGITKRKRSSKKVQSDIFIGADSKTSRTIVVR